MHGDRLAYSISEAAAAIGVSRSTLYAVVARGALPARKIAGRTVILAADLVVFLEAAPAAQIGTDQAEREGDR